MKLYTVVVNSLRKCMNANNSSLKKIKGDYSKGDNHLCRTGGILSDVTHRSRFLVSHVYVFI